MKKRALFFVLILSLACFAQKKGDKKEQELVNQVRLLKQQYAQVQNELQQLTETRWSSRQKHVTTKEENKESNDRVAQEIERLYADVARAKEELLARQSALEKEQEILAQKELQKNYLIQAVNNKRELESEANLAGFPVDQDLRMADLESIGRTYSSEKHASQLLQALIENRFAAIIDGSKIGMARRTFLTDEDKPVTAQVLRFGQAMAYAVTPDGEAYFLGNTGKIDKNRFEWRKITNSAMSSAIVDAFPALIKDHIIAATLPIDILQNRSSSTLVGGASRTWQTEFREWFMAGGPVMVPLGLIVLWAMILILNRIVVYSLKHRTGAHFIKEALDLLSKKDLEKARKLADSKKGIDATILGTCLKHSQWKRSAAEKAIKEILLSEVPKLEKHLNTLAVLTAVAPLLGLLGTITGMIRMFEVITRFGTGDPKLLAGGIAEALITTEAGLCIAIPLLMIHNFIRNRRNRIQAEMETHSIKILNSLWPED